MVFRFSLGWLVFASLFIFSDANARNISVFNIRKDLPLNSKDIPQKDYYLNGGTFDGIKVGSLLTIVRRLPMHDSSTSRPYGDLHLAVAQLKVIYAEKNVSVARLAKVYNSKDRPLVDFQTVMIGDAVQSSEGYDIEEKAGDEREGEKPGEKPSDKAIEKAPESASAKDASHDKADFSSKAHSKEVEKPEEPKQRGPSSTQSIQAGPLT